MKRKEIAGEALVDLRRRLHPLPPKSAERRHVMRETAALYGVSEATLYRALRERGRPRALQRSDKGKPRVLPAAQLERYGEIIAALKVRTSNAKGRHLSTAQAIRLLEEFGVETPEGLLQMPPDVLTIPTVNRYLKRWGYDQRTLTRQPPAVRFQAEHSNACWHFDLSPSDLKQVPHPLWEQTGRGRPVLMLYSVVDVRRAKRHVGMRETHKRVTPWGMLGTPCVFGVQHLRPLEGVSSIPLKGAMRRKQVSKRWCLTKRRHGESI